MCCRGWTQDGAAAAQHNDKSWSRWSSRNIKHASAADNEASNSPDESYERASSPPPMRRAHELPNRVDLKLIVSSGGSQQLPELRRAEAPARVGLPLQRGKQLQTANAQVASRLTCGHCARANKVWHGSKRPQCRLHQRHCALGRRQGAQRDALQNKQREAASASRQQR